MEKNIITYKDLYKRVHFKFHYKYFTNENAVNKILIEKVVFNEKCHLVAVFKDFLITDDDFEFIKKYYNLNESFKKLKIYLQYYEQYSILYPNYIVLGESKYLYKNIHKKQRIIDKLQDLGKDNDKKYKKLVINKEYENNNIKDIFNSSIYNSILKGSENGGISIFGLSNKEHKDEEDNISLSLIKDLIDNIDSSEQIKKFEKNNYKIKNEFITNDINNKKKYYKNKMKGYTNNTTNNNTNISLNTVKSNTIKNNNSITENNCTFNNQGSNTNMDKLLSKEKEQDNAITQKFKSNILNKMKNHYRKNIIFPLKETNTNRNIYLSFKKKLEISKIISKKNTQKAINTNLKSKINIKKVENKYLDKNKTKTEKDKDKEKEEKLKNDIKKCKFENNNNTIYINKTKIKNNKFDNKNKKLLIDLKKCLSEKKINQNVSNRQSIKKRITRNFINNKLLVIKKIDTYFKNSTSLEKTERINSKKKSTKSIFTSSILAMKQKTCSNSRKKINEKYKRKILKRNNSIKNKINYENSLSAKNKKIRTNAVTSHSHKNERSSNSKDKKDISKKLSLKKNILTYNSFMKKDKELLKKIIIKTKTKLDKKYRNLSMNNNSISKMNNSCYHDKKPKKKILIYKKIQNSDFKSFNKRLLLKANILNTINGHLDNNKRNLNQTIKNKLYNNNNSYNNSYRNSYVVNKKLKIHTSRAKNHNNIFTDSCEKRNNILSKKIKHIKSKPKIQNYKYIKNKLILKNKVDNLNNSNRNCAYTSRESNSIIENHLSIKAKIFFNK